MRVLPMLMAPLLLAGCLSGEDVVEQTAREAAKGVVNTVISQRLPGVNAAPYTDCIIDNASTQEVVQIAKAAVTGPDNATVQTVLEIAGRPATTQCIAQGAVANIAGLGIGGG